eukprot:TRINITY_DN12354_c0_g1_i1.p1 TRINITY_DN12354_c0_g1~~TRINITY_DN12354_c0_g1_i1.p1  ORF type:complete len:396 (+),score=119.06 TRINITY_DN12354_c0_g1_i1:102-1289(+)
MGNFFIKENEETRIVDRNPLVHEFIPHKKIIQMKRYFASNSNLISVEQLKNFVVKMKLGRTLFLWALADQQIPIIGELLSILENIKRQVFASKSNYFNQTYIRIQSTVISKNDKLVSDLSQMFFPIMDIDGNGAIDFSEIVNTIGLLAQGPVHNKTCLKFSLYDVEKNGFVSRDNLVDRVTQDFNIGMVYLADLIRGIFKKNLIVDENIKKGIVVCIDTFSKLVKNENLIEKSVDIYMEGIGAENSVFTQADFERTHTSKKHEYRRLMRKMWKERMADVIPSNLKNFLELGKAARQYSPTSSSNSIFTTILATEQKRRLARHDYNFPFDNSVLSDQPKTSPISALSLSPKSRSRKRQHRRNASCGSVIVLPEPKSMALDRSRGDSFVALPVRGSD